MTDEQTPPALQRRYRVIRRIGRGGMGEVLLAEDLAGSPVCIKRLLPEGVRDPEFRRMFKDEARVCASLRHPNVVQVHDFLEEEDELFLVLEYVHGVDLFRLINTAARRGERLPLRLAVYVAWCLSRALGHAHNARGDDGQPLHIIHRDVSPANILVGLDGAVKLTDFGLAKARGRLAQTRTGMIKGTLQYTAPEFLRSGKGDQRADLFSAGVVLWESLTGQQLFGGGSMMEMARAIVGGRIPPPSERNPAVPEDLETVCLKALSQDVSTRYQRAEELEEATHALLRGEQPEALRGRLANVVRTYLPDIPEPPGAGLVTVDGHGRLEPAEDLQTVQLGNDALQALLRGTRNPE